MIEGLIEGSSLARGAGHIRRVRPGVHSPIHGPPNDGRREAVTKHRAIIAAVIGAGRAAAPWLELVLGVVELRSVKRTGVKMDGITAKSEAGSGGGVRTCMGHSLFDRWDGLRSRNT